VIGGGLLALALSGAAAAPAGGGAPTPAADCAALWFGYGDFATRSAWLDGETGAYRDARLFRAAAIRITGDTAAVDAHIARVRPDMALMMRAIVESADAPSRAVFERLAQTCADFAASQPEFQEPA
jgi:hypothetical protein